MLDISSGFDAQRIDACPDRAAVIEVQDLSLAYGAAQALRNVSFALYPREILAFIGPSGCGKTTALKCLNRMHDGIRDVKITGKITMGGQDIMARDVDPPLHRRRFGWVAQKPNPFPCSVFENVAYGARLHGLTNSPAALEAHVESCLRRADLWAEVKDDLFTRSGYELSGGQQQRLCIARALATEPEVMLMDEPTGSIDPVATDHVEALMKILAQDLSVLVITHSLMQARRLADRIGYFHLGQLREIGPTEQIFTNPKDRLTRDFIMGLHG